MDYRYITLYVKTLALMRTKPITDEIKTHSLYE